MHPHCMVYGITAAPLFCSLLVAAVWAICLHEIDTLHQFDEPHKRLQLARLPIGCANSVHGICWAPLGLAVAHLFHLRVMLSASVLCSR